MLEELEDGRSVHTPSTVVSIGRNDEVCEQTRLEIKEEAYMNVTSSHRAMIGITSFKTDTSS